jgi:sulfotransferase
LAAVLRQNPRFAAGMSTPLAGIFMAALDRMSGRNEFHGRMSTAQRERILRAIVESYYADEPADRVIFDTNRVWCAKISSLQLLFPSARLICCVRPVAEILNSFERLAESHPLVLARMYNHDPGGTVYSRADALVGSQGPLMLAYNALKHACYGQHGPRVILLRYQSLVQNPKQTLQRLYELLGERPFDHDFTNLTFSAPEFDDSIGSPGLHDIQGPIAPRRPRMLLPPDLRQRAAQMAFWETDTLSTYGVTVV